LLRLQNLQHAFAHRGRGLRRRRGGCARLGRRFVFLGAILGFTVTSALASSAGSLESLVFHRVLTPEHISYKKQMNMIKSFLDAYLKMQNGSH